jgi:hypothetical protein
MIGDTAYDSDPLDQQLEQQGVRLIAPHRGNRCKPPTQDGRECAATVAVGKSNACLPDCMTFAD